jgi:hypothetical protein
MEYARALVTETTSSRLSVLTSPVTAPAWMVGNAKLD